MPQSSLLLLKKREQIRNFSKIINRKRMLARLYQNVVIEIVKPKRESNDMILIAYLLYLKQYFQIVLYQ